MNVCRQKYERHPYQMKLQGLLVANSRPYDVPKPQCTDTISF